MVVPRAICSLLETQVPEEAAGISVLRAVGPGYYCFGENSVTTNELWLGGALCQDFYCLESACT